MADDLNLNEIPSFDDIAKEYGVNDLAPIEGSTQYFQHEPGTLSALVGKLEVKYKDMEGKACDKTKPGATRSHAIQHFIVYKDGKGECINTNNWELDANSPYGRLVYSQYIPLEPDRQWQNKNVYNTFKIEGMPNLDIVQGGKNDFKIFLNNTPYFIGMPVQIILEQGKKSVFVKEVTLQIHNLNKDLLIKRKGLMDSIYVKLDAKLSAEKAARDAKKSSSDNIPPAEKPEDVSSLTEGWS